MKKYFPLLFIMVILSVGVFLYFNLKPASEKIHYHAGFQVYKDDIIQNFSDFKYMTIAPCTDKKDHEDKDKQLEKAHLHDQVGDVVHVESSDSTWADLFKNLPYQISSKEKTVAYVNGRLISNPLSYPIKPYASAVFYFGKHDDTFIPSKPPVQLNYIKEIEKKTKDCSAGD